MNKLQLNTIDQNKWFKNLQIFLAPVAILYVTTIIGVISQTGHTISLKDLIPNAFAIGGGALYILNSALDYFKKLQGGSK